MNFRFQILVSAILYIFTMAAFAHPGPHSHVGVPESAWHAFIGWEFALVACATGAAWFVIRRLRNTRTQ